jgi:hypothetical protein
MNLRQLARKLYDNAPYKCPEGRVHLRVTTPWAATDYDRRGKRPTLEANTHLMLSENAARFVTLGYDAYDIPFGTREDCTSNAQVAEWDRAMHILTFGVPAAGPDSFATAGVPLDWGDNILAELLVSGSVTIAQVAEVYRRLQDDAYTETHEGNMTLAWG